MSRFGVMTILLNFETPAPNKRARRELFKSGYKLLRGQWTFWEKIGLFAGATNTRPTIKNVIWNIVRQTSNPDLLSPKDLDIKPAWFIFKGQQV